MLKLPIGSALFLTTLLLGKVNGQTSLDRAQLARPYNQQADENGIVDGRALSTPNDSDLGAQKVLSAAAVEQPWNVSASIPFYYTSNAGLTRRDASNDFIFAPQVNLSYQPRLVDQLYLTLKASEQNFVYARHDDLNFASFDGQAGLSYYLPQVNNLVLRALYDYEFLTDAMERESGTFSSHGVTFNIELPLALGQNQRFAIGLDSRIGLATHPDRSQRNELNPYLDYSLALSRSVTLEAYADFWLRRYQGDGSRREGGGSAALGASYRFSNWLTGSVLGSFAANRSNQSFYNYNVANLGGTVTFAIKF